MRCVTVLLLFGVVSSSLSPFSLSRFFRSLLALFFFFFSRLLFIYLISQMFTSDNIPDDIRFGADNEILILHRFCVYTCVLNVFVPSIM